jgi:hypothetical protein
MEEPILEAVNYATPIPSSTLALTHMALVFDRIHFPHVYFPLEGYDPEWVEREAARIASLPPGGFGGGQELAAMLRFVRHAKTLDGFCVFTGDSAIESLKKARPFSNGDIQFRRMDILISQAQELRGQLVSSH